MVLDCITGIILAQKDDRSSLIWVHTVCHRGFLNISADEKSRRLLLRLAHKGLSIICRSERIGA